MKPILLYGKRKKGRPRNTWFRDQDADAQQMGKMWWQLERLRLPQNQDAWKKLVGGTTSEDEISEASLQQHMIQFRSNRGEMIRTDTLAKFHKDCAANVASRVHNVKNDVTR